MGLTGAGMNRFRRRVDAVIDDAFTAILLINGVTVGCSGPGGRTITEYVEGGERSSFRFPFRLEKTDLHSPLAVGDSVEWQIEATRKLALEVTEISERPHEARVAITCKPRRE